MQRGKKQGPFVGRRVPEVEDGVPLLYPRYTSVEDIVLDGTGAAAKAQQQPAAAQDAGAAAAGSKRKAADADNTEPAAAAAAAAAGPQGDADASESNLTKQEKKRLKQERKARERAEQQQQANGVTSDHHQQQQQANGSAEAAPAAAAANTEEAQHIRSVLGFTGPAVNPTTGSFAFDFYTAVEQETQEKLARIMAGDGSSKKHKKQQQQQQQQQPPKAVPVAAAPPAVAAAGSAGAPSIAAPAPAAAAGPGGYIPRRVFVGGMPYHYSEDKVREYWSWCGEVESIDLMTFPDSGRFRGIAFITFVDEEGYQAALACNGENLEGQTLKVDKCKAPSSKRGTGDNAAAGAAAAATAPAAASGGPPPPAAAAAVSTQPGRAAGVMSSPPGKAPGYNVAYVGNIAFEVTPGELQALFEPYGVTKVRLHTDQHTGKSKGYAHVHFADEAGLDRAMELSGHVLQGRGIKVSYGQPKKA